MKLIQIDLDKTRDHKHPDIKIKAQYLCRIGGQYFAGKFSQQWYGLNFQGWYGVGLQLDQPGTNCSRWEAIWEIVDETS